MRGRKKELDKDNIIYLSEDVSQTIEQLKPAKFEFKENPGVVKHGFIAQDVFSVLPSLRSELSEDYFDLNSPNFDIENPKRKDGTDFYYGLDYGKLTPYLTKALQETIQKLEDLTSKIKIANSLDELKSSL